MSKVLPTDIVNDVPASLLDDKIPPTTIQLVPLIDDCCDREIVVGDEFIEQLTCNLLVTINDLNGESHQLTRVTMFKTNKEICKRYVPSRVFFQRTGDGEVLTLLYYTNPSLTYRRFIEEDEALYCCYFPLTATSYSYDMRARVMIDQVMCGTEMYCVFLFGSHEYDLLVSPKM